ncbi:hypothetical protein HPB50_029040 [Hyalomma asiaticum]|nr:hypothetical protein HPB50_029040 [Hyalomma asiaticum]
MASTVPIPQQTQGTGSMPAAAPCPPRRSRPSGLAASSESPCVVYAASTSSRGAVAGSKRNVGCCIPDAGDMCCSVKVPLVSGVGSRSSNGPSSGVSSSAGTTGLPMPRSRTTGGSARRSCTSAASPGKAAGSSETKPDYSEEDSWCPPWDRASGVWLWGGDGAGREGTAEEAPWVENGGGSKPLGLLG